MLVIVAMQEPRFIFIAIRSAFCMMILAWGAIITSFVVSENSVNQ